MWRKLLTILIAVIFFGPALSILYVLTKWWFQPAGKFPDLHTTSATASIVCGWLGLAVALDLVLQVLRRGRRPSHGAWLFIGVAAACAGGLFGAWITWLTPLRPLALVVSGLGISGLFFLLYYCGRRLELRLFGLIFGIAGLGLFIFALREVHAIGQMVDWAKTDGRITHSGASGLRASKFLTRELAYEYTVDGRRYNGSEDSWKSSRMRRGWGRNLDSANLSYGWNSEIAVYYDPDNPQNAVLMPGLSYATAFVLKASLLSLLGGMALLVTFSQLRRTNRAMTGIENPAGATSERLGRGFLAECWPARIAFVLFGVGALAAGVGIKPVSPDEMRVPRIDEVPATADAFCERGLDLLRENDAKRAFNNFSRALRLDPNDPAPLHYDRGHAFLKMGQVPEAVADWKKAIELNWRMVLHVHYARRRLPSDDAELDHLIADVTLDHLGELREVSGYAVGYMGGPGEFYTASLILADGLGEEDFLKMVKDANPVIRAMALICLSRQDVARHQTVIESFFQDTAEVRYVPMGCGIGSTSLAELAKDIVEEPNTLEYWDPAKTKWLWDRQSE